MEDTEAMKKKAEDLHEEMKKREAEAEEAKRLEAARIEEKRSTIAQRVGEPRRTDGLSDDDLKGLMNTYHDRLYTCESSKYDLEQKVMRNQFEIDELYKYVYDLRGKFVKPKLKKVHHEFDDIAVQAN